MKFNLENLNVFNSKFELNGGTHENPWTSIYHKSENMNPLLPSYDNFQHVLGLGSQRGSYNCQSRDLNFYDFLRLHTAVFNMTCPQQFNTMLFANNWLLAKNMVLQVVG